MQDPSCRFILDLAYYLGCVSSITSTDVFTMPAPFKPNTALLSSGYVHPLFGVAGNLFSLLPSIKEIVQHVDDRSTEDILSQAREIELLLQSWEPCDRSVDNRYMTEVRAAAFATQWALILSVNQATKVQNHPQITKAADNILSALSLIRPGSEVEAHVLFPLVMAGVGSNTKANRLTVEYRLTIMNTTVGFGNIRTAHRLLDDVWRLSNEGNVVDWRQVMRSHYPGLVLF
jgi:transcriptional activator protein UGA3